MQSIEISLFYISRGGKKLDNTIEQKGKKILIGLVLICIPVVTLLYNVIFPPIDGSMPSDWRNHTYYLAIIYSITCIRVIIASIVPSIIGIIVISKLLIHRCRGIGVYIVYMLPLLMLLATLSVMINIEKTVLIY